jgi:hypothetical protein
MKDRAYSLWQALTEGQEQGEQPVKDAFARTDTRKNSFAVRAVDNWNELPDSVRAEEKLPHFKRKLKGLAA